MTVALLSAALSFPLLLGKLLLWDVFLVITFCQVEAVLGHLVALFISRRFIRLSRLNFLHRFPALSSLSLGYFGFAWLELLLELIWIELVVCFVNHFVLSF